MTLEEARQHAGEIVIYKARGPESPEFGIIRRCSMQYVFVDYGKGPVATSPQDLTLHASTCPGGCS